LREKVAAKRSDEGSTDSCRLLVLAIHGRQRDPSSVGFADTVSRKGRRTLCSSGVTCFLGRRSL
jgi:hypothetical protein